MEVPLEQGGEIPTRKGKYHVLRTNAKPQNLLNHTKISYSIASLVFGKFSYLKAEVFQVPQKVRTVFVWYLLSKICIFVYSCTACGTSKIYLCLGDNSSSFSLVRLKSETKDAPVPFCLQKIWFLENKNLASNSWRWTNLYLTLNCWRWTNLYLTINSWRWTNSQNLFGNWLLVTTVTSPF